MTAFRQLRTLVGLRWRMVRSARTRRGLLILAAGVVVLMALAAVAGRSLPQRFALNATLLAPTAFAGFALLALIGPLAAGGGNELFPAEQLGAYPVRPATTFLASLAVAPLNLAWLSQVMLLTALTGGLTSRPWGVPLALLTTYTYVALVTVVGQALAWGIVGVRQSRAGRVGAWSLATALVATSVLVVRLGYTTRVLDRLPTTHVVVTVLRAGDGRYWLWAPGFLALGMAIVVGVLLGVRMCGWALRRPGSGVRRTDRPVRRRRPASTALRALLTTDRASVWRTPSLRRGTLVLMLLPAAVTAGLGVSWTSLVLLPGLVAAGTGMLFGVNAFCLDASGGIWLASLPHRPALAAVSKAWVIIETGLLASLAVLIAGGLRAKTAPSSAQLAALLVTTVCCTLWVSATCMKLSLTRPHRADLLGARDTPAPPGSMAVYSARLATSATLIGMLLSVGAYTGIWQLPVLLAIPVILLAGRSLLRSVNQYESPAIRARVVQTVASG